MVSKEIARKRIIDHIETYYDSFKQFEDNLGLKRNTVTEWKRGVSTFMEMLPEIADEFGVSTDYLLGHEKKKTGKSSVPIIGRIQAGCPIESYEGHYGTIVLPNDVNPSADLYALEVVGDSMMPIFMEGDIVVCERIDPGKASGKFCVISIDNESTLKKLRIDSEGVTLIPLNPLYKEIHYSKKEMIGKDFRIDGVVIEMVRKF